MTRKIKFCAAVIASMALGAVCSTSQASLVTNGTFDTDVSGWSTPNTQTGVTWVNGTARVGQPGALGVANFVQSFDIPAGTDKLAVSFDYQWQTTRPLNPDIFEVVFTYLTSTGTETVTLLSQSSSDPSVIFVPPTTIYFDGMVSLIDLLDGPGNGTIRFSLNESDNGNGIGTRVELDNVSIVAVPEASSLLTWAAVMVGGLVVGRRFLVS